MESINIENLFDMNYCYRANLIDKRNKELAKIIPMLLLSTTKSEFSLSRHSPISKA